jgi:hypothetical protein
LEQVSPAEQSVVVEQVSMQTLLAQIQPPGQSALLAHWTHVFVAVSQAGVAGLKLQSPLVVQFSTQAMSWGLHVPPCAVLMQFWQLVML